MKNLLLTGASGFVGKNLRDAFTRAGHEVFGLSRCAVAEFPKEKIFPWDALDNGAIPSVDAVIHLAGKAHDLKKKAGAEIYFSVNTELTKKVFRWFEKSSATQFYFFSSVKAAADFVQSDVLTENCVPAPVGPYGESKIEAEKFLQESFDFSDSAGEKRVYILRPCMIHGRGNKGNLNLLFNIVRAGIPLPLGAFENKRSFLSIANLEFILQKMLEKKPPSGIYNLADDDPLSTNELVQILASALDKKARIFRVPASLVRAAASAGTALHLPFNRERLTKLTQNYVVSNEKIKRALGVDFLPVPAAEGIAATAHYFSEKV